MPKNTPIRIIDSQKTRAASFLGGSASTGGTTDHGLLLGLNDDDHAQYLRTDGTRTLTGNMAVDASVTIDGVDISAHAANANAHHNQQHAITGSDHTVTGSQYQIVGLTSANTLGLLTAASSPTANQIVKTDGSSAATLVDLTVTSDLFVTGTLDFGTNTIAEDATYLQFAGSKALRFAQNIGNANWTLYNAGGYTTTGSISITGTAGDLTVGSNVLFVDNSQANVGINMAPDSQFALDINGPARATYWIGPHAIQLKNVLLLAHYDGRYPYATNLSGEPNGHMGQVATTTGSVVYRPGKFYKAAQFAGAATNLVTNPRWGNASYLTDWTQRNTPTVVASTEGYIGSTAAWVQSAGSGSIYYRLSGLTNGTTYTASVYARYGTPTVYLCNNSFGSTVNATWTDVGDGWYRAVATRTVTDTYMVFVLPGTSSGVNYSNAQIELRNFATPYIDGAMDGHAWTGTAHASTSTRTATTLAYPASGNISASAGTVMAWVWVDGNDSSTNAEGIVDAGSAWPYCALYMASGTTPTAVIGNASGYASATGPAASGVRQWVHVAMTWTGSTLTVYTNGIAGTPVAYTYPPAFHTAIRVGFLATLGNRHINGLIDDFCILGYAASANEIRAIYESNAPVFAETSTFTFRPTPKGLLWADDEGLWMRDTSANPVFGIYGGESTKSWGGFTMAPGDLLIGNNAVGSSAILWDQSAGTFGFYGAGNATAQASVATDGSITAGAGALALNASGIQITAPSSQSSIGSYKFLVTGKTITSGMYAYYNSGADTYYHGLYSDSSNIGNITTVIGSTLGGGGTAKVQFNVTNSLASANTTYTLSGSTATWQMADYVGIGVAPTRPFQVLGGVFAGGDDTGLAGYTQLTNSTQGVSSGTGTVKMNGATSRNSTGWLKIYVGTSAKYVPYFDTVTG